MRELTVENKWWGSDELDVFTFREDGTYRRDVGTYKTGWWFWKIDEGSDMLMYRISESERWIPFFDEFDHTEEISTRLRAWIDDIRFYDSVDKMLDSDSDPR
jgi:hypothetical protein